MTSSRFNLGEKRISMISIVEGNDHLKPYTFNDDYLPLSNDQSIVDAFVAFMEWAIEFIQDIVDMVFGPIVDAIADAIDDFNHGIAAALSKCISELSSTGEISLHSKSQVFDAFYSDLFWVLMGVSVLISIVLMAIVGLTTVFGFILSFAISAIMSALIVNAIGLNAEDITNAENEVDNFTSEVDDSGAYSVEDIAISLAIGMDEEYDVESWLFWAVATIFAWTGFMASMISLFGFEAGGRLGYTSLSVGLAGAAIAFGSALSPELGIFGVLIGLTGFVFGVMGAANSASIGNSGGATCNIIGMPAGIGGALASAKSTGWI